jgi:type I restriction enzyme S subunit
MTGNNIPKHWEIKKLGEVCFTTSGGTPNRGNSKFYQGNIPWVKSGELDRGLILDTEEKISEEAVKNSSAKVFPKGTLLIALYGATIGKLAFLGIDAATNQAVCGIYKNENIDSNYLFNFLFYKKPSLVKQGIGGAQPNISQGILKNLELPIPPIAEQQAIVAKIEELLSDLENGKEQLKTAQQQLKVYRLSLLKWAFEGKEQTTVGELFDFVGGGTPSKKNPEYWQGDIPWASVKDVKGDYLKDTQDRISAAGLADSASNLAKPKDVILITRISPGKTIISNIATAINQDLKIVKPKFETTPKFIFYVFKSIEWECVKKSSGTTVLGINLTSLKEILVPKLNLKQQQLIVDDLESKFTVCDKIEETISQSLLQAETLRQSILKKAFEGKLITTEKMEIVNELH